MKKIRLKKRVEQARLYLGEVVAGGPPVIEVDGVPVTKQSLTDRFEKFHAENPDFYAELVELTREYLDQTGSKKAGIQMLIEVARWKSELKTKSTDFRINNDFAAFYARLIMHQEYDLHGVFEVRRSREAEAYISSLEDEEVQVPVRKIRFGKKISLKARPVNPAYL